MSGQIFDKARRRRLNVAVILILVVAFTISLIPQNALSFQLTTAIEPPLFTSIPMVPLSQPVPDGPVSAPADVTVPGAGSVLTAGDQTGSGNYVTGGFLSEAPPITLIIPGDSFVFSDLTTNPGTISSSDYLYLVKLKDGVEEEQFETLIADNGASVAGKIPNTNIYKISGITAANQASITEQLTSSPLIDSLQRDLRYGPEASAKASATATGSLRSRLTPLIENTAILQTPTTAGVQASTAPATVAAPATVTATSTVATSSYMPSDATLTAATTDQSLAGDSSGSTGSDINLNPIVTKSTPAPDTVVPAGPQSPTMFATDGTSGASAAGQTASIDQYAASVSSSITQTAPSGSATVQQDSFAERGEVPVMIAGTKEAPVEYSATVGDTGMKLAPSVEAGKGLVDISSADKGFSLGFDPAVGASALSTTAVADANGIFYREPTTGATLLLKPDAGGLTATLTTTTADTFTLKMPLYGLFAERTAQGTIAFLDVDTGKKLYEIVGAQTSYGGQPAVPAALSIGNGLDSVLFVKPASGTSAQAESVASLNPGASLAAFVTRFAINAIEAEIGPGASLNVEYSSGSDAAGALASISVGGELLVFGATADAPALLTKSGSGGFTEYKGAAGPADLRFKKIAYGLEQEIVLGAPPASGVFNLPLKLGSLISRQVGKTVELLNADGLGAGSISAKYMYDSRPASEGGAAVSDLLSIELKTTEDGKTYLIVTADEAWLNDPARVYPIFIDPTLSMNWPASEMIVNTSTPTFYWSSPTVLTDTRLYVATDTGHFVTESSYYDPVTNQIHESHNIKFDQLVFVQENLGDTNRFALPANSALPEGRYYWRVFSTDAYGSSWTEPVTFYVNSTHIAGYYGSMPAVLPSGRTITVPMTVKNRGTATWNSTGTDKYVLSYKLTWTDSLNVTHDYIGNTVQLKTALPYDIPAGGEVLLNAKFDVPPTADIPAGSTLTVKWDMRQEGICWFSERAEQTFNLSATVQNQWNVVYEPLSFPTSTLADPVNMRVKVTNNGPNPLDLSIDNNVRKTKVKAHLVDAAGREVAAVNTVDNGAYDLDGVTPIVTIGSGSSGIFDISIQIPTDMLPGSYIVKFDMGILITSASLMNEQGVPAFEMPIMVGAYGVIPATTYHKFGETSALNLISGNLVMSATDFTSSGRGPPIDITRTINTLSTATGVFGAGWSSILDTKLELNTNSGWLCNTVRYTAQDGTIYTYFPAQEISGYQTYVHPAGLFLTLKKKVSDSSFDLVNQDETLTYHFSAAGKLDSITDNNANAVHFNYNAGNQISSIDAADGVAGSRVEIFYDAYGWVDYIKVPSSAARNYSYWDYVFDYDTNGQMISATFDPAFDPGSGTPNSGGLAIQVTYSYDSATDRLTSIDTKYGATDQTSSTRLAYDGSGRLTNICDPRYGTGTIGTAISYSASAASGTVREVSNARDGVTSYEFGFNMQARQSVTIAPEPIFTEGFNNLGNWITTETNVALGKSATASGEYDPANMQYQPANVTDGVIDDTAGSFWLAPNADPVIYSQNPAWVEVNLGESYVIDEMRFLPTHDGTCLNRATREWHISISNDSITYTDVARGYLSAQIRSGPGSVMGAIPWVDVKLSPSLARYVRFYVDSYSGLSGGLNELQVYGLPKEAAPSGVIWTTANNSLTAAIAADTDQMLVSRDSYSDFSFEAPVKFTQNNKDVGLVFRESNNKTNFVGGEWPSTGCYFFRASGYDTYNNQPVAKLFKLENTSDNLVYVEIAHSNPITLPANDTFYKLRVEATGPDIRCYLGDNLVIETKDWSYARGHLGLRASALGLQGPATFVFGDGLSNPVKIHGRALTTNTYDAQRNLVGVTSALKAEINTYDEDVFGWDTQLPENRWSLRNEAENTVIYADDMDGADTMWFGNALQENYSVEASIKIISAAAASTGVGGQVGLAVRSNGDPENGYQLVLSPNATNDVHIYRMSHVDSGSNLYDGDQGITLNQWETLKIKVDGSLIIIYRKVSGENLVEIGRATNADFTKGKIGLFVKGARALFDNVKISDVNDVVTKFDDFQSRGLLTGKFTLDKANGMPSGERYTFDTHNRPIIVIDQNKKRTTVTRDERGNITMVADAAGNVIMRSYDTYGNLLTETSPIKPTYNYLPNPSCDAAKGDWAFNNVGVSTTTYDATTGYDGSSSLKLNYNGTTLWTGAQSSLFSVKPGEIYTISAFVKTGGALQAQDYQSVFLRFWGDASRTPSTHKGQFGPEIPISDAEGYEWRRISKTVAVPAGALYADVLIALGKGSTTTPNTGPVTIWVDALQLEEGSVDPAINYSLNPALFQAANSSEAAGWTLNGTGVTGQLNDKTNWNRWLTTISKVFNESGELSADVDTETIIKSKDVFGSQIDFTADIKMISGRDVGLAFGIQDDSNLYLLRASGHDAANMATLWKKQGGNWTKLSEANIAAITPALNTPYTLRVTDDSSGNINCWLGSVRIFTNINDTTFLSGRIGFRVGSTGHHHFDNVVVRKTEGTPAVFTDDFSYGWSLPSEPWVLDENEELSALNTSTQEYVIKSSESFVNPDFTANIQMKAGLDVGLAFRIQDNGDMYLIRAPGYNGNNIALIKKVGGNWGTPSMVAVAPEAMPAQGSWYKLEVKDNSNGTIICYLNNNQVATFTDTAPSASNKVGLRIGPGGNANHHHFDDVVVKENGIDKFTDSFTALNPYLSQTHSATNLLGSWSQQLAKNTVTPGENYTISARILTSAGGTGDGGAQLHIQWLNSGGVPLTTSDANDYSPYFKTNGDWQRKALTALAPAEATSAIVYLEQGNFAGTAQFDDIRFEKSAGQGEYSLLGNGSFELYTTSGVHKYPNGWTPGNPTVWETPTVPPSWELDSHNIRKFGNYSVKTHTDSSLDSFIYQDITVKPGTTYLLSGWIKTAAVQSGTGAGAVLHIESGEKDVHYATVPVVGDTDWSLQTLAFTTGPATSTIRLNLQQGMGGGSSGTSWFDGVELVEKSTWASSNTYDANGNYVIEKTDPLGAVTTFALNTRGQKTAESSYLRAHNGSLTAITSDYTYDRAGRQLSVTAPAGDPAHPEQRATASATFDKSGHVLTQTAANGAIVNYIYDAGGRVTQTTSPALQIFSDDFSTGSNAWSTDNANLWSLTPEGAFRGTASANWGTSVSWAGDVNWSSYEYQADVTVTSGYGAGLEFDSSGLPNNDPAANYYFFYISPQENRWYLSNIKNGEWGAAYVRGSYACSYGTAYTLKVMARGETSTLYVKEKSQSEWGAPVWTGNLAGFNKGKIGLRLYGDQNAGAAVFDNAVVREIAYNTRIYDTVGFPSSDTVFHIDRATTTTYATDALGRVTQKDEGNSTEGLRTTKYTFDELGNVLTQTDPMGNTTRSVYDASGVCATFDRLGNLTSTIRARNKDNLDINASIDARGNIAVDKANAIGIVATTDERNNSVNNTYSSGGSLASRVDPLYAPYMFSYDVMGRPAVFTDPLGARTIFSRDSLGRLITRTDGRGVGVSQAFTYDLNSRVTTRTDTGGTCSYQWDYQTGALTKATNADGSFTTYSYDQSGSLTGALYTSTSGIKSALYGAGSYGPAYVRDQAGGSTMYSYDAHGQLASLDSSYYAPGTGLALTYDDNGNRTSETFPDGSVATYTYDAENRMASYELKKNGVLLAGETYRYDTTGNRTAAFTYRFGDDFTAAPQAPGWLESSSAPWSQVPEGGGYIYQASSQSGTATSVHQDASLMNCSFQARVMITGTGAADANAGISIKSDGGAGSFGPNQYYFSLYPAGAAACWKLWEITQNSPVVVAGGDITIELNQYYTLKATVEALDASTLRISVFIDGALLAAYNDSSPRTGTGVGLRAGNATARFDDARADGLTTYTYDAADQLTLVRKPDNSTISYIYDKNGNRTSATDSTGAATYSYTYNAANQLTAIKNAAGTVISSFTYDAAGNTITGENATYTHNAQNRLTQVVIANVTYSYAYDAQGRLISRETLGSPLTKTYYRYNEVTGALMHELDINGNITTSYVSDSSGRIISVTRAQNTQTPTTFFYHYNAHGDVTALTDSSGSIIATFTYDAWGVPTEKDADGNPVALIGTWTQSTGGTPGNGLFFLFGGMLYDAAAGLYLTKTRAYNPKTGRFMERDILDESGKKGVYGGFPFGKDAIGTNLYAWCSNNPVNRVDPSGMVSLNDMMRQSAPDYYAWQARQLAQSSVGRQIIASNPQPIPGYSPYGEPIVYRNSSSGTGYTYGGEAYSRQQAPPVTVIQYVTTQQSPTSQANYISYNNAALDRARQDARDKALVGMAMEFDPLGDASTIASQGFNTYEYWKSDKNLSDTMDIMASSGLIVASTTLKKNKYIKIMSVSYSGAMVIDAFTNNPKYWTCTKCHKDHYAEIWGNNWSNP